MKTLAIILVCVVNGAVSAPRPGDEVELAGDGFLANLMYSGGTNEWDMDYDWDVNKDLQRGDMKQIRKGFQELGVSLGKAMGPALKLAKEHVPFIGALINIINEQIFQEAGSVTANIMSKLVFSTSKLGVPKLFDEQTQQSILATFHVAEGTILTTFSGITVKGDAFAAQQFIAQLNAILQAPADYTPLQVLGNVQMALLDLVVSNGIANNQGVQTLKNFFNLDNLIDTVTHPLQTAESLYQALQRCQESIPRMASKAVNFVNNVKTELLEYATLTGKAGEKIAANVFKSTLDFLVTTEMIDKSPAGRLLATFAPELAPHGSRAYSSGADVTNTLSVKKDSMAAKAFVATIGALADLKNSYEEGVNGFALVAGAELAVVELMAANTLSKLTALSPILHYLGLSQVGGFIRLAADVVAHHGTQIVKAVEMAGTFAQDIKTLISKTLENGGQLTTEALAFSLEKVLKVAVNNKLKSLFTQDVANTLTNAFVAGNELTAEAIDALPINSEEAAKVTFVSTLKDMAKLSGPQAAQEAKIAALAGVNVAVIDLLVANGIMEVKGALALKQLLAN